MSTVAQICAELVTLLGALPNVDQASKDIYEPPITTRAIALIITPFGQQGQVWTQTARRTPLFQSHRIRCEFWVKLNTGGLQQTMALAREIALLAIRALVNDTTNLGGTVQSVGHYGPGSNQLSIEYEVADRPTSINGIPYIVAVVDVPVTDYADA